jgi:RNA 2',3'-cyclic 3'-phosphodiesterase
MGGVVGRFRGGSLFFAVGPPADAASRICRLGEVIKCARQFQGALTSRDCLHVTLFSLGEACHLSDRSIRSAFEAGAEVKMEPFEISFDRSASFRGKPGGHPFVLLCGDGLNRLMAFRQSLGAEMTKKGLRRRTNADFTPHITLLRDARKVEEQPIVPICWTVSEFVLIHSNHGHTHLARWSLHPALE